MVDFEEKYIFLSYYLRQLLFCTIIRICCIKKSTGLNDNKYYSFKKLQNFLVGSIIGPITKKYEIR